MLSYETALEELGFDYDNELTNMHNEFPLVQDGLFGIIGSPWQQSKTQTVQKAPTGTPSSGRPAGKPATPKKQNTDVTDKTKVPNTSPSQSDSGEFLNSELSTVIKSLSDEEYEVFINRIKNFRNIV